VSDRPPPEIGDAPAAARPSWPVVVWHAIRPHTLPLSLSPVVAGTVLAWVASGVARLDVFLAAALSALAIQIGTNLHNDAADTLNHTDDDSRLGPVRVTERGWMTAGQVMRAAHLAFAVSVLCGAWLVVLGGWPIAAIGLVSVLAGYAYSAGPWPISRGPWGELLVILFFGLIAVGGVVYLHTGTVGWPAVVMGLIVGLPAAAVLVVNNTRDRVSDARAGRRTLAILIGRARAVDLHGLLLGAALLGLGGLALLAPAFTGALLGLVCLPLVWRVWRGLRDAESSADYNAALARTGRVQVAIVLTSSIGLLAF